MAQGTGQHSNAGSLLESLSGVCNLGSYGSAVFESTEYPRIQFWYLCNGRDFVLATHVCSVKPDAEEVAEAQQIIGMLGLSEGEATKTGG